MTFADWLDNELSERGWSIRAFARKLDPENPERGRRNLHRYLAGTTSPGRPIRKRIAVALEIEVGAMPANGDRRPSVPNQQEVV